MNDLPYIPHLEPRPQVALDSYELDYALEIAQQRRSINQQAQTNQPHGDPSVDGQALLTTDQISSCAELLVAKWLNIPWGKALVSAEGIRPKKTNVGPFKVRSTSHLDGSLVLHEGSSPWVPNILVIGIPGSQIIRGWTFAYYGKKKIWWPGRGKRPCYMVPQKALLSSNLLISEYGKCVIPEPSKFPDPFPWLLAKGG